MHAMNRDATTITAAHETTSSRMTLDPGTSGVHRRNAEINVMTYAFQYGRFQCHAKIVAAIIATTTVRAIGATIAAIKDRKSDSNEHHAKATAVTSAKPHAISRLPGESRSLDKA